MRTRRTILAATAVSSLVVGIGIAGAQAPNESGRANGANAPTAQHGTSAQSQHGTPSEPHAQSQGTTGSRGQQSTTNNRMDRQQPSAQTEKNRSEDNRSSAQNERGRNETRGASGSDTRGKTEQNRGTAENRTEGHGSAGSDNRSRAEQNRGATENRGTVGSENRSGTEQNRGPTTENRANENRGTVGSENRGRTEQNRGTAERNEGNRGSTASLSTEQRTRIHDTILHESNAPRISRGDISTDLRVGSRIPRDRIRVRPLPLPSSIVEIEPQWRGYLYFLAGDEIVVVEPSTYEVVAVIPA